MPIAWLSLDKDDNQGERFISYLVAALKEADNAIGSEAIQLLAVERQVRFDVILTSLINDLEGAGRDIVLVLDDYQVISNQAVHEGVAFLLEHCPTKFHLVIVTRSDPPLPLTRLRGRGQLVELRAADLSFTEAEAAQFLNEIMGLDLEVDLVAALAERTEGWIAGLQMASIALQSHLSMRDREDLLTFIEGFSGTNRYIMDYLLEEVLASQTPEIQRFLLYTSILERLTAPLCDSILVADEELKRRGEVRSDDLASRFISQSTFILEYLERANLFLVPLDDERVWYRYHQLFADLMRTQLQKSLGAQGVAQLHIRAVDWHVHNGSILEAIHHASIASDDERVERLIEENYMEIVNRGEMSWLRSWTGQLTKEQVYGRPWLCIYEAQSQAWFGELDEADRLLEEAEKRIQSKNLDSNTQGMLGHLAYVRSRVTAMRGDIHSAIELCLVAGELIPASDLGMQLDINMTLGYEYFLSGDYANASQVLKETIRLGAIVNSVINSVAAHCIMARLYAVQGLLNDSYELYREATQTITEASGQHLGAKALIEMGFADVLYERNDLVGAHAHIETSLSLLPFWGKVDDFILAYLTLARIHLSLANKREAMEAVENAIQFVKTRGVFSEARNEVEIIRVKLWLAQGDFQAAQHWAEAQEAHLGLNDRDAFEKELTLITLGRVMISLGKPMKAMPLLGDLEGNAREAGRMGRIIEILQLKALALHEIGELKQANQALTECLSLVEPEGYVRVFLDEGKPMQVLLAKWLADASGGPQRSYAIHLLSQFDAQPQIARLTKEKVTPSGDILTRSEKAPVEPEMRSDKDMPVETLSPRELEVLNLVAQGKTNKEIAQQLIVAPGTIKAHAASIYRKLDVANRTEAVARARQLGIIL